MICPSFPHHLSDSSPFGSSLFQSALWHLFLCTARHVLHVLASAHLSSPISVSLVPLPPAIWPHRLLHPQLLWASSLLPWGLCPHCFLFLKPYATHPLPGWHLLLHVTQAGLDYTLLHNLTDTVRPALTGKLQRTGTLGPGKSTVTFTCHSSSLQVSISPLTKWGYNTHQTYKTVSLR